MNYIWAGLIVLSLVFALINDTVDLVRNTYENGHRREVGLRVPLNADLQKRQEIQVVLPGDSVGVAATWRPTSSGTEILIPVGERLPALWRSIAADQDARDKSVLAAEVVSSAGGGAVIVLPEVRFVKMRAIAAAAFDMAEFAVELAIGLVGIMALWLGLMRIADQSGLVAKVVVLVAPVMRRLFPNVPADHPALGAMSLNIAANMLGLGNAATPLGIKAMEELQKLNPDKEKATNAMCMFLSINTASVQLVPPVTLIALLGVGVSELFLSIILTTAISTTVAILVAMWYARRNPEPVHQTVEEG